MLNYEKKWQRKLLKNLFNDKNVNKTACLLAKHKNREWWLKFNPETTLGSKNSESNNTEFWIQWLERLAGQDTSLHNSTAIQVLRPLKIWFPVQNYPSFKSFDHSQYHTMIIKVSKRSFQRTDSSTTTYHQLDQRSAKDSTSTKHKIPDIQF